jgi:maltodextrin utilization protein YvdJ
MLNTNEMVSSLWYENLKWFLGIFVVLALVRIFVLLASSRGAYK